MMGAPSPSAGQARLISVALGNGAGPIPRTLGAREEKDGRASAREAGPDEGTNGTRFGVHVV
jgi:hypothetical protein